MSATEDTQRHEAVAQLLWQIHPITRENVGAVARKVLELADKPRIVTAPAELASLSNGAQIRDSCEELCEKVGHRWRILGALGDYDGIHIALPATVLHEPGAAA